MQTVFALVGAALLLCILYKMIFVIIYLLIASSLSDEDLINKEGENRDR